MSSHHIVREKQEPALLVMDARHFDPELLGQLLEWSPTVIATAMSAEPLLAAGIHIDWLLSPNPAPGGLYPTTQVIPSAPPDWLPDALNLLLAKGYPAVNVVADEFRAAAYLPFISRINTVAYCRRQKIYAVKPGFEKWMPAGAVISLLQPPLALRYENLKPLSAGLYEVVNDGFIKLHFDNEALFIGEGFAPAP